MRWVNYQETFILKWTNPLREKLKVLYATGPRASAFKQIKNKTSYIIFFNQHSNISVIKVFFFFFLAKTMSGSDSEWSTIPSTSLKLLYTFLGWFHLFNFNLINVRQFWFLPHNIIWSSHYFTSASAYICDSLFLLLLPVLIQTLSTLSEDV